MLVISVDSYHSAWMRRLVSVYDGRKHIGLFSISTVLIMFNEGIRNIPMLKKYLSNALRSSLGCAI